MPRICLGELRADPAGDLSDFDGNGSVSGTVDRCHGDWGPCSPAAGGRTNRP